MEHSLANVRREESFCILERRNEILNRQRDLLKRDINSFVDNLASMGGGRPVFLSSTHKHTLNAAS